MEKLADRIESGRLIGRGVVSLYWTVAFLALPLDNGLSLCA